LKSTVTGKLNIRQIISDPPEFMADVAAPVANAAALSGQKARYADHFQYPRSLVIDGERQRMVLGTTVRAMLKWALPR